MKNCGTIFSAVECYTKFLLAINIDSFINYSKYKNKKKSGIPNGDTLYLGNSHLIIKNT